ncbi:hypothetical protein [Dyadobacter sp. BHUBP1]
MKRDNNTPCIPRGSDVHSTFGKEPEPVTLEPLPAFLWVMDGYLVIE